MENRGDGWPWRLAWRARLQPLWEGCPHGLAHDTCDVDLEPSPLCSSPVKSPLNFLSPLSVPLPHPRPLSSLGAAGLKGDTKSIQSKPVWTKCLLGPRDKGAPLPPRVREVVMLRTLDPARSLSRGSGAPPGRAGSAGPRLGSLGRPGRGGTAPALRPAAPPAGSAPLPGPVGPQGRGRASGASETALGAAEMRGPEKVRE